MSLGVGGLVLAYVVLATLLLSINLTSLWRWWVKAGAIVVTTAFFGLTYYAINGLMGWPTAQRLPPRFTLLWSLVSEPNHRTNSPGAIYLWVDELDANNVPAGRPRSYQLAYSDKLARKIAGAQERRENGKDVMGVVSDRQISPDAEPKSDIKMGQVKPNKGEQNAAMDTVPFMDDGTRIGFEDLPPIILPEKGPL